MSSTPKISKGLNKFTPGLFDRMGKAIEIAERSEFKEQLKGFKVWPSFWATIFGYCWLNNPGSPPYPRIRKYLYLWSGGGFSSGMDPELPDFSPAVNLAEARDASDEDSSGTYLGINIQRLKTTGLYQVPYITSGIELVNEEGELDKGLGPRTEADGYFTGGTGPTVRMYLMEIPDPSQLNPATGEPFGFDDPSVAVYAFSATPNFDGPCE